MIKLFFLMIFFFAGFYSLKADEAPGDDQKFTSELNNIKNPFEDGIPPPPLPPSPPPLPPAPPPPPPPPPKPVVIVQEPKLIYHAEPKPIVLLPPKPIVLPKPRVLPMLKFEPVVRRQAAPEIALPVLKLEGVMVGEDMHQAIINGQVVPLFGTIEGARVVSVSKEGVGLSFRGKKFLLKVD